MEEPLQRDSSEADAEALSALFEEVFTETFGHLYQASDLATFLAGQTASHWAEQLRDDAFSVRVIEDQEGLAGLAKVGPVKLPVNGSRSDMELRQLYVHQRLRGSGAATNLMDWAVQQAQAKGAKPVSFRLHREPASAAFLLSLRLR